MDRQFLQVGELAEVVVGELLEASLQILNGWREVFDDKWVVLNQQLSEPLISLQPYRAQLVVADQ